MARKKPMDAQTCRPKRDIRLKTNRITPELLSYIVEKIAREVMDELDYILSVSQTPEPEKEEEGGFFRFFFKNRQQ